MLENVVNLALSAYYILLEYQYDQLIKEYVIDAYYPNICTCLKDIDDFKKFMKGDKDDQKQKKDSNAKYIGVCSESLYNQGRA